MMELRVRAEKLSVRSAGARALCLKCLHPLGWFCFALLGTYVAFLHMEARVVTFGSFS